MAGQHAGQATCGRKARPMPGSVARLDRYSGGAEGGIVSDVAAMSAAAICSTVGA
jgi:hypothetical protein